MRNLAKAACDMQKVGLFGASLRVRGNSLNFFTEGVSVVAKSNIAGSAYSKVNQMVNYSKYELVYLLEVSLLCDLKEISNAHPSCTIQKNLKQFDAPLSRDDLLRHVTNY